MIRILKWPVFLLHTIRCIPHLLVYRFHPARHLIRSDVHRWKERMQMKTGDLSAFLYLLARDRAFRNVLHHRVGSIRFLLGIFCPQMQSLHIDPHTEIGEGFYIHFGNGSVIGAKRIGKNCTICQQVTVGTLRGLPVIGDDVSIYSGAVVMGNIQIGNHASIGANATVIGNVADHSTVMAPPPRVMKWKGSNSKEK